MKAVLNIFKQPEMPMHIGSYDMTPLIVRSESYRVTVR